MGCMEWTIWEHLELQPRHWEEPQRIKGVLGTQTRVWTQGTWVTPQQISGNALGVTRRR